jgi:hypothetical protein
MPTLAAMTRQSVENAEPLEFVNAEPVVYYYPQITMSATVTHRGRQITVVAADMSADQFCDVLDKRFGPPTANPTTAATSAAPAQAAVCQYHGPMKESTIKGKEGTYYCTKKMADGSYCKEVYPPKK